MGIRRRVAVIIGLAGVVTLAAILVAVAQTATLSGLGLAAASSTVSDATGGFTVTYTIGLLNSSTGALHDLHVTAHLARAFPFPSTYQVRSISSDGLTTRTASSTQADAVELLLPGNQLLPGQKRQIVLVVQVQPGGASSPFSTAFTASASGVDDALVQASTVAEVSESPSLAVQLPETSSRKACLGAALQVKSVHRNPDDTIDVKYVIRVANCGQADLGGIQVAESLGTVLKDVGTFEIVHLTSSDFTVNPDFDGVDDTDLLLGGDSLAAGGSGTIELEFTITPDHLTAGYWDQVMASGVDGAGNILMDLSERGSNPDPDGDGDPTNDNQPTWVSLVDTGLTGAVDATILLTSTPSLSLSSLSINTFYRVDEFVTQLSMGFTNDSFSTFALNASAPLGPIATNLSLALDPTGPGFRSLQIGVASTIRDVSFTDILLIAASQTDSYNQLAISGSSDPLSLQATLKFGVSPVCFQAVNICGSFDWEACDTTVSACAALSAESGFQYLSVSLSDLVLFENLLGIEGSLNVTAVFSEEEKTISPSLTLVPDWVICPEIDILSEFEFATNGIGVTGFSVYGMTGELPLGETATFSFEDSFAASKDSAVTGSVGQAAAYSLDVLIPGCCGAEGSLEGTVFVARNPGISPGLFGIDLLEGSVTMPIGEPFSAALGLDFDLANSTWEISLGLGAVW